MGKDFKAIIHNEERKKQWIEVLGTNEVYLKSPFPYIAKVCGKEQRVYLMDLDLLTKDQKDSLISHLAEKFDEDPEFVRNNIDELGVPVLAKDCSVIIKNLMRWL
jgi:hypothetical protein